MQGVVHIQGLQDKVCKLRTSGGQRHKDKKNNVYVLKENREECHLRKHDEASYGIGDLDI